MTALTTAVRQAARFDRSAVSVPAGLLAAIPVGAALGIPVAAGDPVAGVTMGAGAMLVGIAWRTTGGRPPLAVMAADALLMALSTFVGCVTGTVTWLHIVVLCAWSLMGGLLVGLGNRGGALGAQAIIAVVVFGRFGEPVGAAAGIAGLVLAGGATQVAFQTIVRWPPPLRVQRRATATAYRTLAELAAGTARTRSLPAAAALDEAQASLASFALFGDPALVTLRSLVNEGHRLRVQLIAIHGLVARSPTPVGPAAQVLALTAEALALAADTIDGDRDALPGLRSAVDRLSEATLAATPTMERRLTALAGQMRAVGSLAPPAAVGGGLRDRRPLGRTDRPLRRLRADLTGLRAFVSLESPAGRHALRLAVVVPLATLIARELPLQRGYWMVVAAAMVLRPEFGATFTRGTERVLGTCLGVGLAGVVAVALHPAGAATVLIVGLLAWVAYATFPASFAVGFAFITALVVFLLNVISPDTLSTASARLLDTLVGGAIGLLVYAAWPTWSSGSAQDALAALVRAQRAYLAAVMRAYVDGHRPGDGPMRAASRTARRARTNADAIVARSLSEPRTRRIDADRSQGALGATRRLALATHVLRLDAQESGERPPLPALRPLAGSLDDLLAAVETELASAPAPAPAPAPATHPDVRARYDALARDPSVGDGAPGLLSQLDEVVDAADGLAELVGPDPAARP